MKGDRNEEILWISRFAHFKRLRDRPTNRPTDQPTDRPTDGHDLL